MSKALGGFRALYLKVGCFGKPGEIMQMARADLLQLLGFAQLLLGILADSLQHPVARFRTPLIQHDQRFFDEPRQKVENMPRVQLPVASRQMAYLLFVRCLLAVDWILATGDWRLETAYCFRRFQCPAPRKH